MKKESKIPETEIYTLGCNLDRTLCVLIKCLNKELRENNLNFQHSDFSILKVLNLSDGISQSDLSRILGKERSAVSRSVSSLEQQGYLQREARNGCTNSIILTQKGKEIISLLDSIAQKVTQDAFAGFTKKRREATIKNLTAIFHNCQDKS